MMAKYGQMGIYWGWQRVSILILEYLVILPIEYSVTRTIFFYQHCTFRALSCLNRAARKVPLERSQTADFRVLIHFIQQFSVSFIHLQSSEKNRSMIELSPLFLNTISSVNAQILPIFKMVRVFDQQKLTIYIYHV